MLSRVAVVGLRFGQPLESQLAVRRVSKLGLAEPLATV